jgi:EAL domain-containing protein (putative c-di-GMP-specific phosphodiesterase class I)
MSGQLILLPPRAAQRNLLAEDLEAAIEERQLVLHYQPKVALNTRSLLGFEALVRWEHPERGLLQPAEFIWLAEEARLMIRLSQWVVRQASRQMASWQRSFPLESPLTISVNISWQYLTASCLIADLTRVLEDTGLQNGTLRLEIEEYSLSAHGASHASGAHGASLASTLRRLKEMQIGLEIEGFGAGSASLNYLRNLPVDTWKIDGSFIRNLGRRNDSSAIIGSITELAASMGITTGAHAVETESQRRMLTSLGCRRGQGFYFSPPLDTAAATALLREQ